MAVRYLFSKISSRFSPAAWLGFWYAVGVRITGTSAAQNGQVIPSCPQCGALLVEDATQCAYCSAPLGDAEEEGVPVSVGAEEEPEWRREVARRLENYRARRKQLLRDDPQSPLPFWAEASSLEAAPARRERVRVMPRRRTERFDIEIAQPRLDFSAPHETQQAPTAGPEIPVASLSERRLAGTLDLLFLSLTYAGFLAMFRSLGGRLEFGRVDLLVSATTFLLFYTLYFSLFTSLAGTTPGMQARGLHLVRMDGTLPRTHELLWRSFGYVISGATLALGFFWAVWDEEGLTWHDRISQTYVTPALPLVDADALTGIAGQSFAHK